MKISITAISFFFHASTIKSGKDNIAGCRRQVPGETKQTGIFAQRTQALGNINSLEGGEVSTIPTGRPHGVVVQTSFQENMV